jgi:hypothetical protein
VEFGGDIVVCCCWVCRSPLTNDEYLLLYSSASAIHKLEYDIMNIGQCGIISLRSFTENDLIDILHSLDQLTPTLLDKFTNYCFMLSCACTPSLTT